jgi:serine/threonine protein kinase
MAYNNATGSLPFPLPSSDEDEEDKELWTQLFEEVEVREFLNVATTARTGHKCHFGSRMSGTYNAIIVIIFDDGMEWVFKIPKTAKAEGNPRLISELATLQFLADNNIPKIPRVHGFALTCDNAAKTPFILMDCVRGKPLYEALRSGISRDKVQEILRQLATLRKSLHRAPFREIGSLTIISQNPDIYGVSRQISIWNYFDFTHPYKCRSGPFDTSLEYYANLHHTSWSNAQRYMYDPENEITERWQVHSYLGSVLASYVGEETGKFYLAHTDLDAQNILVDENGDLTGIIDWEFASTLPPRAADHYPKLLSNESVFTQYTKDVFSDPQSEFREWRQIYAEEFLGDPEMENYLEHIDSILAFEDILRDNRKATMQSLVETCKFIDSATTFKNIGIPFPWKFPTTSSVALLSPASSSTNSISESCHVGVQLEANSQITEAVEKGVQAEPTAHAFSDMSRQTGSSLPKADSKSATSPIEKRISFVHPPKIGPMLPFPVFDISESTSNATANKRKLPFPSISRILKLCFAEKKLWKGGRSEEKKWSRKV